MLPSLEERVEAHRTALLSTPFPGFGRALKPFYGFDANYVPLNNGSFGACPNHVLAVYNEYLTQAERRPDTFLRVEYKPLLYQARQQLSDLVGCNVDDLVLINNATSGVNAILRGLNGTWKHGDAILVYETVYGACGKAAQYIVDSNAAFGLKLVKVSLNYPVSHDEVVSKTQTAIRDAEAEGTRIRVGIVDAISSLPGVIVPWERIVSLFKAHSILSLVDAAHAVGQIRLNLTQSDPDFFISNCHKWLSAHRGVAFLYTPKRNQSLALAMPTSHDYLSPNLPKPSGPPLIPTNAPTNYVATWEWTGTQDFSNYLSLPAAIEFRKWLGGEEAILDYNSNLARKAGSIVSQRLGNGSVVMEVDDATQANRLTAAMVNVSIPINGAKHAQLALTAAKLQTRLTNEHDTFVVFYVHAGRIWIRLSAQVWLQEDDFVWVADRINELLIHEGLQNVQV